MHICLLTLQQLVKYNNEKPTNIKHPTNQPLLKQQAQMGFFFKEETFFIFKNQKPKSLQKGKFYIQNQNKSNLQK